jgi:hypothetical protein
MTKLVYIGGYGHSGTTLLEYLMAGSPEVLACGEVVSSVGRKDQSAKEPICSCGLAAENCPVWGSFQTQIEATGLTHAAILAALMSRTNGKYAAIIDSSKTAWGSFAAPFRLRRKFGSDFVLVHLIRQPAAVCWSALRKKNRRAKKEGREPLHYALRCGFTVAAWSIANLACELFGLIYPSQCVRLRYEDMVRLPAETLQALFRRVRPGIEWSFDDPGTRDNRHQLHGNSVKRHELEIADVKEDLKWMTEMPPEYSRVILALSYPLRVRYGY